MCEWRSVLCTCMRNDEAKRQLIRDTTKKLKDKKAESAVPEIVKTRWKAAAETR